MDVSTLVFSLGPTGEESIAVLLDLMVAYAHRHEFEIPEILQVLARRGATVHASQIPLDNKVHKLTKESGLSLRHVLPEIPWLEEFQQEPSADHPSGCDRVGLAEKCWQEWVESGVHSDAVPWFKEINHSIARLRDAATLRGIRFSGVVNAYVLANLSDAQEAAIAYALGAFLRTFSSVDVRPLLVASLSPRCDVSQVGDFAVGRAVAALHDLARNWASRSARSKSKPAEHELNLLQDGKFTDPENLDSVTLGVSADDWPGLGYLSAILIHGPVAESGRSAVALDDVEVSKVMGQVLFGLCLSDALWQHVIDDRQRHDSPNHTSPFLSVTAAGYWFSPRQFARYSAVRIVGAACSTEGTDLRLHERIENLAWPPENTGNNPADEIRDVVQQVLKELTERLRDRSDAIVKELGGIVDRAGYHELLRPDICRHHPIAEWPQVIRNLVGIVEQGVIDLVVPALDKAVERQIEEFRVDVLATIRGVFHDVDISGRLVPGTAVVGGLRLFEQTLPDICQATRERVQAANKHIMDNKSFDREIARRYDKLCRSSRQPPHTSAMLARAALVAVAATAANWAAGINLPILELLEPVNSIAVGGLCGLFAWLMMYVYTVALQHRNCNGYVRAIVEKLGLRFQTLLHRAKTSALDSFHQQVFAIIHHALNPEDSPADGDPDAPTQGLGDDISRLMPALDEYSRAWRTEHVALEKERETTERTYQNSTYLQAMPNIPGPLDRRSRDSLERILGGAIAHLIGDESAVQITDASCLAAVRACLRRHPHSLWNDLLPSPFHNLPTQVPWYFERLVATVGDHLFHEYYKHMSINDVLSRVPPKLIMRLRNARDPKTREDLTAPESHIVSAAERRVLLQELFSQTGPLLAVPGLEVNRYFWFSPAASHEEDFFLNEAGLERQTDDDSRIHTDDKSVAVLVSCSCRINTTQLLQSPESWYRDRLDRLRGKYPGHPELKTLSD